MLGQGMLKVPDSKFMLKNLEVGMNQLTLWSLMAFKKSQMIYTRLFEDSGLI